MPNHVQSLGEHGRWTSGEAVSSDDFVWSWRRNLAPELGATFNYLLFPIRGGGELCRRRAQPRGAGGSGPGHINTERVHLDAPTPGFLAPGSDFDVRTALPRAEIEGTESIVDRADPDSQQWAVQTGAMGPQSGHDAAPHTKHYGGPTPPAFDDIVVRFPRSRPTRGSRTFTQVRRTPPPAVSGSDYRSALANADLRPQGSGSSRGAGTWFIVFKHAQGRRGTRRDVRRALSLALDRGRPDRRRV